MVKKMRAARAAQAAARRSPSPGATREPDAAGQAAARRVPSPAAAPVRAVAPPSGAWDRATRWLALPEAPLERRWLLALMVLAWALGVVVRLLWLSRAEANPQSVYEGHVTLTATDGYYFAASAQAALDGVDGAIRRLPTWTDHALVVLGVLGAQLAPLQDVIVYVPVFVAPLLAVPLVLLGQRLGAPLWGFGAGLLASVGWSYFARTLPGYFDTDMFSVTVPVLLVVLLMTSVVRKTPHSALIAAGLMVVAPFFYDQIDPVLFAIAVTYAGYLLLWHRHDAFAWSALAGVALALLPVPTWLRLPALVVLALAVSRERLSGRPLRWTALALGVAALASSPALHLIVAQLGNYANRGVIDAKDPGDIAVVKVGGLVREMVRLPFAELAERFAGSVPGFIVAAVGFVLAALRYRPLWLLAPLIALAAFAPWGGLRFTIYGVPIAAIGLGYLAARLGAAATARLGSSRARAALASAVAMGALAAPVVAQVEEAAARPPVTVVLNGEADLMARLGAVAKPGDYAIAWWDFGYPLWYFGHVATLIDGGKHGRDNLIVSQILLTPSQRQAANLARAAVERCQAQPSAYEPVISALFAEAAAAGLTQRAWLAGLAEPAHTPPTATRDIYLHLPHKLLTLLGAVEQFSRDARASGAARAPMWAYGRARQKTPTLLQLEGGGFELDMKLMKLKNRRGEPVPVRSFHLVESGADGSPRVHSQASDPKAPLHVVLLKRYGMAFVCDDELFNSTAVQLYALGRYDATLFAPVVRTPFGAVYRLLR